jgi:hypothetical protein
MGSIHIGKKALPRLLADTTGTGACYQQAFTALAATHRGRPPAQIVSLLRRAADQALLGFTAADLREQAEAITTCRLLRGAIVRLTGASVAARSLRGLRTRRDVPMAPPTAETGCDS